MVFHESQYRLNLSRLAGRTKAPRPGNSSQINGSTGYKAINEAASNEDEEEEEKKDPALETRQCLTTAPTWRVRGANPLLQPPEIVFSPHP